MRRIARVKKGDELLRLAKARRRGSEQSMALQWKGRAENCDVKLRKAKAMHGYVLIRIAGYMHRTDK